MQLNAKMYNIQNLLLTFFSRMFFLFGALISTELGFLIRFELAGLGLFVFVFFLLQRRSMLPDKPEWSLRGAPALFRYGLALTPSNVILYANSLFSSIYLNARAGAERLDIYEFLTNASLALSIIQNGFANFWGAFMFANYRDEQRRIQRVHEYITYGVLSLMACLILVQPAAFLLLGLRFRQGQYIFGLMLFSPMLLILSETTVYGIDIATKTIHHSIGNAISAIANVLLCILLVPRYDIAGAAAALAVSGLLMFLYRTVRAQRYYRSIDRPLRTAVSVGVMAALCAACVVLRGTPVLVSIPAFAVLVFYQILYRAELGRCIAIAKGFLKKT